MDFKIWQCFCSGLAFRSHSSFCSSSGRKECETSFSFLMGTSLEIHHYLHQLLSPPQLLVSLALQWVGTGVPYFPLQVVPFGFWAHRDHISLPPFLREGSRVLPKAHRGWDLGGFAWRLQHHCHLCRSGPAVSLVDGQTVTVSLQKCPWSRASEASGWWARSRRS